MTTSERAYAKVYAEHVLGTESLNDSVGGGDEIQIGVGQAAKLAAAGLLPTNRILEVGCGIGRIWHGLPAYVDTQTVKYVGLDVVPELVAATKNRLSELRVPEENGDVRLVRSLDDYPVGLEAQSIFAFSVFTHMEPEDIVNTLRVLKLCSATNARGFFTFLPLDTVFGRALFDVEASLPLEARMSRVRNVAMTESMAVELAELGGWRIVDIFWEEAEPRFTQDGQPLTNQSHLVLEPA